MRTISRASKNGNRTWRVWMDTVRALAIVSASMMAAIALAPAAMGQDTPASDNGTSRWEFEVGGQVSWIDTGIDLRAGDEIAIQGSGTLTLANDTEVGPAGANRGFRDLLRSYPVNTSGEGALIGRLGENQTSRAFLIGAETTFTAQKADRLFLGLNKSSPAAIDGGFQAVIEMVSRAPAQLSEVSYDDLPAVTLEMIDRIPRRVVDAEGNEGDNNNFVIVGPEQAVVGALESNGWVQVDRDNQSTVMNGIMAVLNREAYLTIPMSPLMMFGRVQDYGFAHAEPIAVVAERHHFRIWKAPFTAGGRELWVGAGTHDIGFDRDQRNNGITHKIDPKIDLERDYIGASLEETGMVAATEYIMPSNPNKQALTATGGSFESDGRVLVIYLKPQPGEVYQASPGGTVGTLQTTTGIGQGAGASSGPNSQGSPFGDQDREIRSIDEVAAPDSPASYFEGLIRR